MDPVLERVRRFAAGRDFVVSREQLRSLDVGTRRIESWLDSGRLVSLFRGVYSYGRDVERIQAVHRAALLVGGPGSALTGSAGLGALGAWSSPRLMPRTVEVATARDRGGSFRGRSPALCDTNVVVLRRPLGRGDFLRIHGIRTVRPALALIDFAVSASRRDVRYAFLELCRLKHFTRRDVRDCFERSSGRRGATKVKPLLSLWTPGLNRIRSVFEGLFLLAWTERRLIPPEVNSRVFGWEVDLFWPSRRLAVELDGAAFHGDPIARVRDGDKDHRLASNGIRVIRVTWEQFHADPESAIRRVLEAIEGRGGLNP